MGLRNAYEILVQKTEWKSIEWEGNDNITPWSSDLESLIVEQLVKKYPAFYGRFITVFTTAYQRSPS
jgi:hypothetical protein